ncbi:MAG TPA: hypothetical protein ENM97_08245 [Moorella mulderi]|nr:hypothetical protein [Moorella mulderi]
MDEIFVCEPTGGAVGIGEKGALWLRVVVLGKSCHAFMPHLGVSTIGNLFNRLFSKFKKDNTF